MRKARFGLTALALMALVCWSATYRAIAPAASDEANTAEEANTADEAKTDGRTDGSAAENVGEAATGAAGKEDSPKADGGTEDVANSGENPVGNENDADADSDANQETAVAAWSRRVEGVVGRGITGIVRSPKDPERMLGHVLGLGVAESRDGGETWALLAGAPTVPGGGSARITFCPREDDVVYLVVDGKAYRSEDRGTTFKDINSGALAVHSWDKRQTRYLGWEVVADPKKLGSLLLGTRADGWHHGGLFKSDDGGFVWEALAGSESAESGLGPDTFWVRRDPKSDKNVACVGRCCIYFSDKGGRAFKRIPLGEKDAGNYDIRHVSDIDAGARELYIGDSRGVWLSRDTGKTWSKTPLLAGDVVALSATVPGRDPLCVLADRGVVVMERGKAVPLAEEGADAGFATLEVREVLPHPRDRKLLLLASPATGLWRSADGGETIEDLGKAFPAVVERLAAIAAHPADGHTHLLATKEGRIFRSADHGKTWSLAGRLGMIDARLVPGLAAGHWWALGARLLASTDDGASWTVAWAPTSGSPDGAADLAFEADGRLCLLTRRGQVLVAAAEGGPFAAGLVKPMPLGPGVVAFAMTVDPLRPNHWAVAARTSQDRWTPADTSGGIYETWTGGTVWLPIHEGIAPKKEPSSDQFKRYAWWNHGCFLGFDRATGLLIYGAHRYGWRARRPLAPDALPADKKAAFQAWVDVSPPEALRPAVDSTVTAAVLESLPAQSSGDEGGGLALQTRSRLIVQLESIDDKRTLLALDGASIAARWEAARLVAQEKGFEAIESVDVSAPWTVLPDPGIALRGLFADAPHPGRLLAVDARGREGALVYETPGATDEPAKEPEPENPAPTDPPVVDDPAKPTDPAPSDPAPSNPAAPTDPAEPTDPAKPAPEGSQPVPPTDPNAPAPGPAPAPEGTVPAPGGTPPAGETPPAGPESGAPEKPPEKPPQEGTPPSAG